MSSITQPTYSNPSNFCYQRASYPCKSLRWLMPALVIAGVALTIIGALAIASHFVHLGQISHFFKPLTLYGDIGLASGGLLFIGLAIYIAHLLGKKEPIPIDQILGEIDTLDFKERTEPKLYYYIHSKELKASKEGSLKKDRVTLIQLKDGSYHIKSKVLQGQGRSKDVYRERRVGSSTEYVRSVEKDPPASHEMQIYTAMKTSEFAVKCLEVVKNTDGRRVLILEYCELGTFKEANKRGDLTYSDQLQIFEDCLRGLTDLHHAGFLHSDLHANNLFVTKDKRGRLADFGSCRPFMQLSNKEQFKSYMPVGTQLTLPLCLELIPPEIIENIRLYKSGLDVNEITGKADVWSLGYELAKQIIDNSIVLDWIKQCQKPYCYSQYKGFVPHVLKPEDAKQYQEDLLNSYPGIEPDVGNHLEHLIWQMLHPLPEQRPTPDEAANALQLIREKLN